jgi:hypothetical protein
MSSLVVVPASVFEHVFIVSIQGVAVIYDYIVPYIPVEVSKSFRRNILDSIAVNMLNRFAGG